MSFTYSLVIRLEKKTFKKTIFILFYSNSILFIKKVISSLNTYNSQKMPLL